MPCAANEFAAAKSAKSACVGRLFPSMPNHLRISLDSEEQRARFQPVLGEVLQS